MPEPNDRELAEIAEQLLEADGVGFPLFEELASRQSSPDEVAELQRQAREDPYLRDLVDAYWPLPESTTDTIVRLIQEARREAVAPCVLWRSPSVPDESAKPEPEPSARCPDGAVVDILLVPTPR